MNAHTHRHTPNMTSSDFNMTSSAAISLNAYPQAGVQNAADAWAFDGKNRLHGKPKIY